VKIFGNPKKGLADFSRGKGNFLLESSLEPCSGKELNGRKGLAALKRKEKGVLVGGGGGGGFNTGVSKWPEFKEDTTIVFKTTEEMSNRFDRWEEPVCFFVFLLLSEKKGGMET